MTDTAPELPNMPKPPPADTAPKPPKAKRTRKARTARPDTGPTAQRRPPRVPRRKKLEAMFGNVAISFMTMGLVRQNEVLANDGHIIMGGAADLAEALDQLGNENPRVGQVLDNLLTGSAWAGVATAVAAIAIPVAANHSLLPPAFASAFASSPPMQVPDYAPPAEPEPEPEPGPPADGE